MSTSSQQCMSLFFHHVKFWNFQLFCGRWQRMPCAPATVFDASAQVCVWDSQNGQPGNLPTPAPYVATQPQRDSQCSCTGGVQIGSCNANYQCPGQSVCQIGQSPASQSQSQQNQNVQTINLQNGQSAVSFCNFHN